MRRLALTLITLSLSLSGSAQSMRDLFKAMPDSIMPLLNENNRLDFIDFIDSKMEAKVRNLFGGQSTMVELTDDYLQIQLTSSSLVELKLLPYRNDSTIICRVNTFMGPLADSRLQFYTTDWKEITNKALFTSPDITDFWCQNDSFPAQKREEKIKQFPYYLVKAKLNREENALTLELQQEVILSEKERKQIANHLQPVRYEWKEQAFVQKNTP